ncbi:MAG: GNAT family N-acetyltransferase [Proteobacteria bacterium]|nr:GNAT family N-acetyltransferase [Pseudomonadota bacterium]
MAERSFSERDFYLAEFRGRTLGLVLAGVDEAGLAQLDPVLVDLRANETGVVLISGERSLLEKASGGRVVARDEPRWVAGIWRALRAGGTAGLLLDPGAELAPASREIALRLRLAKLLWIDPAGPLRDDEGGRISFVTLAGLAEFGRGAPARGREALLAEVGRMLEGGIPSVSICRPEDLAEELFTYAGSGSFFARESYTDVRPLAIDEFDTAHDLIQRGVDEGYLVPRAPEEEEEILAGAFGVFVEGRFLAGIGALHRHPGGAGEIASLYTLTRFAGEGVGGHLIRFALARAREQDFDYVFACTTSDRVVAFFERNGFRRVGADEIPEEKWQSYDADRRRRLHCLRRDL